MSSRSLAAARSRRAGENAPPISGSRPGTSIGSQAAFQQPPSQPNVRVARGQQPPSYQQQQQQQQQQYPQQQFQQPTFQQPITTPPQNPNGLPFTKLSISDAIGLITIRLGRVEQWIIETDHENDENGQNNSNGMIDNSVLTTFVNRLDSLEKKESNSNLEVVTKLSEDFTKMNENLSRIIDEASKHSILTAKHTEQLFRFEREFVETKDILKTFMLKYDQFANEINDKFADYEYAISELEKNVPVQQENQEGKQDEEKQDETANDGSNDYESNSDVSIDKNGIMSVDLKNLIKNELTNYE